MHCRTSDRSVCRQDGFTLVELMITLCISGIIVAAIYSTYTLQQQTYAAQDAVVEMQQNIRAALMMMSRDIRMAGYAPQGGTFGFVNGGFPNVTVTTDATNIAFTADLDSDGALDTTCQDIDGNGNIDMTEMEMIAYRLNGTDLERYSTTTGFIRWQDIAENINQIEFLYLDANGNPTTLLPQIRSVQISILARAENPDPKYTDTRTYTAASGAVWGPYNDNFRRRLLITTVQCRNMGL